MSMAPMNAMNLLGNRSWTLQPTRIQHNQKRTLHIRQLNGAELPHAVEKCPVAGSVLLASGYVQNLYRYGDENSPTVQLVRRLFHEHENIFAPSISKSSPALSITPERSAQLIKSLDALTSENDREKIITQWRADHEKISGGEKLTKSQIIRVLDLIEAAKKERNSGTYPYPVLPWVISGFTAAKAETHAEIERYLVSIGYPQKVSDYVIDELLSDCKALTMSIRAHDNPLLHDKSHGIALAHILDCHGYIKSKLPPMVESLSCGFKEQPAVTTCQEDALRSLVNCFVYDPEGRKYNYILAASAVHSDLKNFYANHSSIDTQGGREAAQAWMDIVSGLPGIEYCAGRADARYELQPSIKNVFNLINRLLCDNTAHDFNDLGKKLSTPVRPVSFAIDQKSDREGIIKCSVADTQIVMYITPGHAYCEFPRVDSAQDQFVTQDDRCDAFQQSLTHNTDTTTLRALMQSACFSDGALPGDTAHDDPDNSAVHDNQKAFAKSSPSRQQYYLFANKLSSRSDIVARTIKVFDLLIRETGTVSPYFIAQIERLMKHGDGEALRKAIIQRIEQGHIRDNFSTVDEPFKTFLKNQIADDARYRKQYFPQWWCSISDTGLIDDALKLYGKSYFRAIIFTNNQSLLRNPALDVSSLMKSELEDVDGTKCYPLEYAMVVADLPTIEYLCSIDPVWRGNNIFDLLAYRGVFDHIDQKEKLDIEDIRRARRWLKTIKLMLKNYIPKTPGGTALHDFAYLSEKYMDKEEDATRFLKAMIRLLRIDPYARDLSGRTALEIARERGVASVITSLEEALGITDARLD